ncbi:hypothetical protein THAOC_13189 [Thalassiosira oceanica]|uniref:Uncharacterized protein n=1 Tax=Thalassiosira oceanica TaxID=159749 RepID=K0SI69_THAOC|nr:hypothetical protein THAOC_13189 [Thalassiosira oceanica]|mmetsp:Transcript_28564/g.64433  ORF Transcript_28564/g.64433 Transcript_28564/m.64433 type:complete len:350 (-) Transcript_28564:451-1500(-)|eukprot:EJK65908.1 hypothetical protein THAOC_13189 [Thalassiosira oceanica]
MSNSLMRLSTVSICCCPVGAKLKVHVTMLLFFAIALSTSLQFAQDYPIFVAFVGIVYGPILILTALLHVVSQMVVSAYLGCGLSGRNEVILWPLGGFIFSDGLAITGSDPATRPRGDLKCDIKIALAGSLIHVIGISFWLSIYALINDGDIRSFAFRGYLTEISSGYHGFLSTMCEQACLMNVLSLWFNMFIPSYPLDGSRLYTSAMLLMGVQLNKAALLNFFVGVLVTVAMSAWSIASFVRYGVGMTSLFSICTALHVGTGCYCLYNSIVRGKLKESPLYGRDCYIYRDVATPYIFQMSNAARSAAIDDDNESVGETPTAIATETIDQSDYLENQEEEEAGASLRLQS